MGCRGEKWARSVAPKVRGNKTTSHPRDHALLVSSTNHSPAFSPPTRQTTHTRRAHKYFHFFTNQHSDINPTVTQSTPADRGKSMRKIYSSNSRLFLKSKILEILDFIALPSQLDKRVRKRETSLNILEQII